MEWRKRIRFNDSFIWLTISNGKKKKWKSHLLIDLISPLNLNLWSILLTTNCICPLTIYLTFTFAKLNLHIAASLLESIHCLKNKYVSIEAANIPVDVCIHSKLYFGIWEPVSNENWNLSKYRNHMDIVYYTFSHINYLDGISNNVNT